MKQVAEQLKISKAKNKKIPFTATLEPDAHKRLIQVAEEKDWAVSKAAGYLIKLGLQTLEERKTQTVAA